MFAEEVRAMNVELKSLPKHMRRYVPTLRGLRCLKRREVRTAEAALSELSRGCAYTPAQQEISAALELLREARRKLSVKNWGKGEAV